MTAQLTLFDTPAPIARRTDKLTSQLAANETIETLNSTQATVALILGRATQPRTANELAAECVRLFGGMAETYRKRAHELYVAGRAVECDARRCGVTGKMATTYRRTISDNTHCSDCGRPLNEVGGGNCSTCK